jgi:protein-S-isoprenylcysteine O-methyltransferase Ste14
MLWRIIIHTLIWLIALAAIVFAAAGDWTWPSGWAFLIETGVFAFGLGIWLANYDPALAESRMSMQFHRDQPTADRVFMSFAAFGFVVWLVVAALDGGRFHWSLVPIWARALGAILIAACMISAGLVFRANSFAAPQIRIQADRGQAVATTGPYRFVRHPMYAAAILYFIGVPLLLGSLWALVPVPIFVFGFAWRATTEERVLRQALPDYPTYAERVRFRFMPGVW